MSTAKKKIKVLLVDDHPVVRKGLLSCLSAQDHLKIVGEASNGADAIKLVKEHAPDIVLMDVSMPGMDGLAVTEALRKEAPLVKVLILSMQSSRDPVLRIIKAGARGYVLKDAPTEELVHAIETVYAGEAYFSKPVAQIALNQYVSDADDTKPVAKLSEREREVLRLMAQGLTYQEAAEQLIVSLNTVRFHVKSIYGKLGVDNRTAALEKARSMDLLS